MSKPKQISDTRAMISGMRPALDRDVYVFCTSNDPVTIEQGRRCALAWFAESEGTSLILRQADAERLGLDVSTAMARIELQVLSSLDGVGLTAAVATALAARDIACNMVAAYHHDHVFVPLDRADEAMGVLQDLSART